MSILNNFLFYDILFLIIFTIWVIWFLYTRKHNLKREGIIYLYRTKLGIKFINYVGKKYRKTIKISKYLSVATGFILMISILFLFLMTLYTYVKFPQITDIVKAPPLLPLIPYFPSIFGLQSFFPPLYFTYWIIAILVVAVVHEFSHGIFAKYHNVKIKSTGFAFLGPILGAFVEPDEIKMAKKKNFEQMSILSAGVFANIITAGIFFLFLWGVFVFAFEPSGIIIYSYASSLVPINEIKSINGIEFDGNFIFDDNENFVSINSNDKNYLIPPKILREQIKYNEQNNLGILRLYFDSPALKNNLSGAISKIDGNKIKSIEDLNLILSVKKPGDNIIIETIEKNKVNTYEIILVENPINKEKAFLGININAVDSKGFRRIVSNTLFFKEPAIYYSEKNNFLVFIYYLIWWIVVINFFVALFNMLPVGILDGGRFFYLAILSLTKSEKISKAVYKWIVIILLFILFALLLSWIIAL
ncbi:MAG: site-2 protease family protein [Candidatus Pacearchaeota archaeon]